MNSAHEGAANPDNPAVENQREPKANNVCQRHTKQRKRHRIGQRQGKAVRLIEIRRHQPFEQKRKFLPRIAGGYGDIRKRKTDEPDEQKPRRRPQQRRRVPPGHHGSVVR